MLPAPRKQAAQRMAPEAPEAPDVNDNTLDGEYPPASRGWYVVAVLTLAYMISFLDRQILALLVEPIRQDLGLSDTQISLLLGLAFAIFYTLLGLPLGRLADRYSRRTIIAAGITVWCMMTAACGLAKNFTQLFLARVGVGVGEATLNPCALSLISDYFPRKTRGRAISVYNMGVSLGAGTALILGGWIIGIVFSTPTLEIPVLGEVKAWQAVFLVVGLPGLLVAALMATIKEPPRRGRISVTDASGNRSEEISIPDTIDYLLKRWRTYGSHFLGMSVVTIIGYALFFWIPTLFVRTWDWSIPQIGVAYGIINLVCGPSGVLLAGWLADRRYARGDKGALIRTCLLFNCLFIPFSALAPLMPSAPLALLMLLPASIGGAGVTATGAAALMMYTPNQLRAQVTALYYFVISVLGLTLGPTAVALFTDQVFGDEAALRYSLSIVCVLAGLFAIGFMTFNLGLYRRAVAAAELAENETAEPIAT
jgi:MFS family permease